MSQRTGADRVAAIERIVLETGVIPIGPCRVDDPRWVGRCPNGRIADWIARKHEVAA